MTYYKKHVFLCTNQKMAGKKCCADANAEHFCHYMKTQIAALNLHGENGIRVSSSGCLGRCSLGPSIVIYPEGVWYSYANEQDINEIITSHLVNNKIVERLLMKELN